jgi:hypothetical protein
MKTTDFRKLLKMERNAGEARTLTALFCIDIPWA